MTRALQTHEHASSSYHFALSGEAMTHDFDKELISGLERLVALNPAVDLVLARHATGEDLGASGEFESFVRSGSYDVGAIESVWWTQDLQRRIDTYMHGGSLIDLLDTGVNSFSLRLITSLRGSVKDVVIADIPSDSESGIGKEMRIRRNNIPSLTALASDNDKERFARYQSTREWCALSTLGNKLQALSSEDHLAERARVLVVFGRGHEGLVTKLSQLGLDGRVIRQGQLTDVSRDVVEKG